MNHGNETYQLPSAEEIRLYHEDRLSDKRRAEIDRMALDNPLVADALEGFSAFPAFGDLPPAKPLHKAGPWAHILGWGAGLIGGALIALLLIPGDEAGETEVTHAPVSAEVITREPDSAVFVIPAEIDVRDVQGEIPSSPPHLSRSEATLDDAASPRDSVRMSYVVVKDYPAEFMRSGGLSHEERKTLASPGGRDRDFVRVGYYHIADYTVMQSDRRTSHVFSEGHVPASKEGRRSGDELTDEPVAIGYIDYWEICLDNITSGDYAQAVSDIDVVLEAYPDDVNAQFYKALALYRWRKYDAATHLFEAAMRNRVGYFSEDARYYRALCMYYGGKRGDGVSELQQIVEGGGFYSGQALGVIQSGEK
jgi:hypothetical protein